MRRYMLIVLALVLFSPAVCGATLLVNNFHAYSGYYYGGGNWTTFSSRLSTAFGASNITVDSSQLSSTMNNYDAVLVCLRNQADTLSAAEVTAIQNYLATGKRIVIFGENVGWATWNSSILGLGSAMFSGTETSATLTPAISNALTTGITAVSANADGIATGGTAVFTPNVITLLGANQNYLTFLSVNILDESGILVTGNGVLATNLATWLGGGGAPPPPPPAVPVLSFGGLVFLAALLAGTVALALRPARNRA